MKQITYNDLELAFSEGKEKIRISKDKKGDPGYYITESSGYILRFYPNAIRASKVTEDQAREIFKSIPFSGFMLLPAMYMTELIREALKSERMTLRESHQTIAWGKKYWNATPLENILIVTK